MTRRTWLFEQPQGHISARAVKGYPNTVKKVRDREAFFLQKQGKGGGKGGRKRARKEGREGRREEVKKRGMKKGTHTYHSKNPDDDREIWIDIFPVQKKDCNK